MANRRAAQDFILEMINKMSPIPNNPNVALYKELFDTMSDGEFDVFIKEIEEGKRHLAYISPNLSDFPLTSENNFALSKELNNSFLKHIWIGKNGNVPRYLSPNKFLVLMTPYRRQSQLLTKKRRIPDNDKVIDQMSFQPTNASKGAKISLPELAILLSMSNNNGLDNVIQELIKVRAGDQGSFLALKAMMNKTGTARLSVINRFSTGVQSTIITKTFLTAMHLKNNILA